MQEVDAFGKDFEKTEAGFVDFLLLDEKGFPLAVLEAKSAGKDPLAAKEQARIYARELDCRFVILSNGDLHYLWDVDRGNPHPVSRFPGQASFKDYRSFNPNSKRLASERVSDDYIALTQKCLDLKAADPAADVSELEAEIDARVEFLYFHQDEAPTYDAWIAKR